MTLPAGTKLGVYEIIAPIGAGGMGEVYRARDTQLSRDVAVKTLPASLAGDADRLARFQREAQMLAALAHPGIAAIYDLEHAGGAPALVMELVDGETLAERIARAPLSIDEIIQIARQIADALEAAHDRGIVHRDLKPSNIKVRGDGTVKVLDFGLAKAIEPVAVRPASQSMSPTLTSPAMTQAGLILGTAAYMSPEQAKGREVDRRADIWAFGCVLYEMLTGRRAFGGEDVTDTLAAVVLREPDWTVLPQATPTGMRRLLRRCLAKNPGERVHHIGDARLDLLDRTGEDAGPAPDAQRRGGTRVTAILGAALVVLVAVAGVQTWRLSAVPAPSAEPVHFTVPTPAGYYLGVGPWQAVEMSPDGSTLALTYRKGQTEQIFLRRLAEDTPRPLPGIERGSRPFFSPDGKWLAFAGSDRVMKKVSIDGGPALTVTDDFGFGSGTWTRDDQIIYTPDYTSGLALVSAAGGPSRMLTEPASGNGELGHFWPQILPDGRHVLFTAFRTPADTSRIEVYDLTTGTRKVVVDGGYYGRYAASGHLLFARSANVMAIAFDASRLEPTGQAVPVVPDVAVRLENGVASFSVSSSGTLAYVSGSAADAPTRLAWLDRSGASVPVTEARRRFSDPSVSPDGTRIALTVFEEGNLDIWTYEIARDTFSRMTSSPDAEFGPAWSPDGTRIFFDVEEPLFHVYSRPADGSGEAEPVLGGPFDVISQAVSPDGRFLLVYRNDPSRRGGLAVLPLVDKGDLRVIVDTTFREGEGRISPDGDWFLYSSNETGQSEVYMQRFPDGGQRVQLSRAGGRRATWSPRGNEVFFREGDRMMSVSIREGQIGRPVVLFEKQIIDYDVAPDGRFLAILPDEAASPAPANVVVNWFQELRKAVAVN